MSDTVMDSDYLKQLAVLYVEDNESTRAQCHEFLSRLCGSVVCAIDGIDGFEKFRSHAFDIIISDIRMPRCDGLTMCRHIREIDRKIPIIILTAFDQSDDLITAIDVGIDKYVTKPVEINRLEGALLDCARRRMAEELLARHEAAALRKRQKHELDKISAAHLQAEMQLIKSEQRMSLAMQCAKMAYWELDFLTNSFTLTDEFFSIFGTTAQQVGGYHVPAKRFSELFIHPEEREQVVPEFKLTSLPGILGCTKKLQFKSLQKDGSTGYVTVWGKVRKNSSGKSISSFGIIQDISELVAAQEAQRLLKERLFHAQKLESIGRLAGGVAHDFNNKLTVIMGCAELARLVPDTPDKSVGYLREISLAAEYSRDIAAQLLAFSRQQVAIPRIVTINSMIMEISASLARLIGEDIHIEFHPAEQLWPIRIDPVQLDQIIVNLAINARDAMPHGGTLVISTANRTFTSVDSDSGIGRAGEYVQITVTDSGSGIPPEHVSKIFEPFFTTKDVGKGTGLGLATVHGIVCQNHGYITVTSSLESGTTFSIYLPRCLECEEPVKTAVQDDFRASALTLLVEDDDAVRSAISMMLESCGLEVIACATPAEALRYCQQKGTQFDLIVSDVVMPGMSGKMMVKQLLQYCGSPCILYMSGYASDVFNGDGSVPEYVNFLQKPVTLPHLRSTLKSLLAP